MILQKQQVKVRDIAAEMNIRVGCVETIIHDNLRFHKICPGWVPHQLTYEQKWSRMTVCKQLLNRFRAESVELLQSIITSDDGCKWLYNSTPKTKRSSMEWLHKGSPQPKKSKKQQSAGEIMASVFWDMKNVIHVDFLDKESTINAQ
ncbi:histone-lysine N-methyltransferase SETMAR-like [Stegodyphus dumicola]|uniref:histone-lysine N-methyltransferase SETMAR-like n=1 Tax=Stegodyphus dumicola TaxID=202533 RepID=UPI0015AFB269|nr:histone-lysine N-methyltransferase SETMAR-like [Stegodyphus dumicola]